MRPNSNVDRGSQNLSDTHLHNYYICIQTFTMSYKVMISQESLWCAIMQYPGTWLPGPEHQNHWRRCFAILPEFREYGETSSSMILNDSNEWFMPSFEAGHETIVWRVTLVSIKNGKMALHWYWRSVNWRSECLLLYIGVCVLSSIGESLIWLSIPNLPYRQLKTSPQFPAIRYLYALDSI